MQPHQERVVAERADLDDKIAKLTNFTTGPVWGSLTDGEQERLERQLRHMKDYRGVLDERIAEF